MKSQKTFALILLLCTVLIVSACGNAVNNKLGNMPSQTEKAMNTLSTKTLIVPFEPLTVVDATGTELEFPKQVMRVACIVSLCIDILAELGLEPVAIAEGGVRTIATQPEFYGARGDDFASIGGSFFEPNLEDLVVVKPDLVIGLMGVHDAIREGLNGISPVYLANPKSYQDSIAILETMGKLMGKTDEANAASDKFLTMLEEGKRKSPKDKKALIMYGSDVNFSIVTGSGLGGTVLREITAYPWQVKDSAEDPYGDGSIPYSLEKLLEENPDTIFIESYSYSQGAKPLSEQLAELPLWSKLKAVQDNQVIEVRSPIWGDGRGTRSLGILLNESLEFLYPDEF